LDDSKQDIKKTLRDLRRHTRVSYGTNAEKNLVHLENGQLIQCARECPSHGHLSMAYL